MAIEYKRLGILRVGEMYVQGVALIITLVIVFAIIWKLLEE